jgi:hypothetical protein
MSVQSIAVDPSQNLEKCNVIYVMEKCYFILIFILIFLAYFSVPTYVLVPGTPRLSYAQLKDLKKMVMLSQRKIYGWTLMYLDPKNLRWRYLLVVSL